MKMLVNQLEISKGFVSRFRENCLLFPDEHISYYDGKGNCHLLTFKELGVKVNQLAGYLSRKYPAQERVVILLNSGLDFVIVFCACLQAGLIAVPLAVPRRNRKFDFQKKAIRDVDASACISNKQTIEMLTQEVKEVDMYNVDVLLDQNFSIDNNRKIAENDIAFIQYTSGSTRSPKGVKISHGNLLNNLSEIQRKFEHSRMSKGVIWLPNYHDMGLVGGILQPLFVGFSLILLSPMTFLYRPYTWLKLISDFKGTTSGGPNFAYDICVKRISESQLKTLDLSSWDVAFVGAEPVRYKTLQAFADKFSVCGFKMEAFYPCYGMAESTLMVSGGLKSEVPRIHLGTEQNLGSKSNEQPNPATKIVVGVGSITDSSTDIRIVHTKNKTECPEGEEGELWIAGKSIFSGYWNTEDLTSMSFDNNLFGKRFFKTGDLGFVVNDQLFITGRLKELIIIDGRNFYPQDIEYLVQECHESIIHGKVAAFSSNRSGSESLTVVVEIRKEWMGKDLASVVTSIRKVITDNFELNASLLLARAGSIPITSSGKVQRLKSKLLYENQELVSLL